MTEQYEPTPPSSPMKRVEDWKARLIDLSKKNNLLYFKKAKRGNLTITQPDSQKIFDALVVKKNRLEFYLPPEEPKAEKAEKQAMQPLRKQSKAKGKGKAKEKEAKPEAKVAKEPTRAATVEAPEAAKRPGANQLVCGSLTRQELERNLKALERRSLLDYRERGVRILYAAFGTLNWVDAETKETVQSPLILVPLELGKETIREPYSIALPPVEDEAVLNPALQAKLKNDYRIDLPPLPEEWEEAKLADYYAQVEAAVARDGLENRSLNRPWIILLPETSHLQRPRSQRRIGNTASDYPRHRRHKRRQPNPKRLTRRKRRGQNRGASQNLPGARRRQQPTRQHRIRPARPKLRHEGTTRHRQKPNHRQHDRRMHRQRQIRAICQRQNGGARSRLQTAKRSRVGAFLS